MLITNETQLRFLRDRISHFPGRYKPVHGGNAYAVLAADSRAMSNPAPLLEARLSFIGNQLKNCRVLELFSSDGCFSDSNGKGLKR